jgi:hypothetical protein
LASIKGSAAHQEFRVHALLALKGGADNVSEHRVKI